MISTPNKIETIPEPAEGEQGQLGYWMSPEDLDDKIDSLFPGCMRGDTPYFLAMLILNPSIPRLQLTAVNYDCKKISQHEPVVVTKAYCDTKSNIAQKCYSILAQVAKVIHNLQL